MIEGDTDDVRRTLLIATSNPGKAKEFGELVKGDIRILSLADVSIAMPEETGKTFQENAELKAVSAAKQTGLVALADDSGLEVDALDGAPGVYSARYSGLHGTDAENRHKLLGSLEGVPPEDRTARFICAVAVATPEGEVWTEIGVLEGVITDQERGESGFGYDRLFQIADGRTLGELPAFEKNAISHRGRAIRQALPRLTRMLAEVDQRVDAVERRVPQS